VVHDGTVRPYREVIVISPGPMRAKAWTPLEALLRCGLRLQHFTYQELSYDPLHHFLACKHTRLSKKEAKAVYSALGAEPTCFPTIYTTDPTVKHLGFRAGDLVRIERPGLLSLGIQGSVFYRRVAPGPKV
jgi:DNA-directed RNA polymerase subunit H (RpoH/RPB5)